VGRSHFATAGLTPAVPALVRGLIPALRRLKKLDGKFWFRANLDIEHILRPSPRGSLAELFEQTDDASEQASRDRQKDDGSRSDHLRS